MLAIDHIVVAAKDPAQAAHDFGKKYHVTTIEGGKHDNWGTYNYLAYLENECYIEWIGIFDEGIADKSANPLIQQLASAFRINFEGVMQFALRTESMDEYIKHFDAKHIAYTGPIPGSRARPDGSALQWRMLFPESNKQLPFLIEWSNGKNMPQNERVLNKQHLHSITFGVEDQELLNHIYQLDVVNNKVELKNGILRIENSENLTFELV
ncbi:VOC family protein [Virgibacillus sp. NKC19-16]|uniref:VOC family protein n=1 Tax=Virgibacillus salidurans TaxID=2831673 RepID=UPI001F3EA3C6|nr:VOC family protein [Virgibacillus sp. NKC19-16]UJL47014.1 VOC family protein [Virgibacillus sp. NKC19-16]